MTELSCRGCRLCDELNIKNLDDFLKIANDGGKILRVRSCGRHTVKEVLLHMLEKKLGSYWMRILWTVMMEKVIAENGDTYWKG